jgi:hypothetical protein
MWINDACRVGYMRTPPSDLDIEILRAQADILRARRILATAQAIHDERLARRRRYGKFPYGKRRLRKSYWLNGWIDGTPEA